MTLLEFVAALAVISLMLGGMVSVCDALANDSAQQQTVLTLRKLNQSLAAFVDAHDAYPDAHQPERIDTPMARCIAELRASPATGHLVAELPGLTYTAGGWFTVYDGFGQPMRYVVPADPEAPMRDLAARFPRSPKMQPYIVSAGPDGRLGNLSADDPQQRADAADNLYSFDLETQR